MILNIITIVIVIIAVIIVLVMYLRFGAIPRCEECQVCPELVKGNVELDIQFSENNKPSKVHDNMFMGRNVYLGGYSLDF